MSNAQYPHGKLNDNDEGALQILVYTEENNVVINFGKPVAWIAMPPNQIRALADLLLKRANELDQ